MSDFSALMNAHPDYIESLYKSWQANPASVASDWSYFFKGFDFSVQNGSAGSGAVASSLSKELAVFHLIQSYRERAHALSKTNPIKPRKDRKPHLQLSDFGLSEADWNTPFAVGSDLNMPQATLGAIVGRLQQIYCGTIGFEFCHIFDTTKRKWLQERIENRHLTEDFGFSLEKKRRILEKLNGAVGFEQFLATKFIGQKRFGLEGGEGTIPALDAIICKATEGDTPAQEIVIGMAHRGRLNVLANIVGKTYQQIFSDFYGKIIPDQSFGSGDVKYHLGFSSLVPTPSGREVYIKLLPNPSHLEAVNPLTVGFVRSKIDHLYQNDEKKAIPILIHGDAAIAGQGIVYEVAQMMRLKGYNVGGTIHLVINNQIGFTTSWEDARSSNYCTSIAEVTESPVFHVNGDDPEALVFVAELATEYRQTFHEDVYIDIVCYRKNGHNESDEPRFTQPKMWELIGKHPDPRVIYTQKLIARGDLEEKIAREMEVSFRTYLQARLDEVQENPLPYHYQEPEQQWRSLKKHTTDADYQSSPDTGIPQATIDLLLDKLLKFPPDFQPLPQIAKLNESKIKMVQEGIIDWQLGELLAYGSLLLEGRDVRMSGQDVRRGTFSHRHAIILDKEENEYSRLSQLSDHQGQFRIFNSLLSEYAVLGFEYGYAWASPENLVIWEAQFGDFANGASTIIDQYLFAAEAKWGRMNGIVLLLPHGYEGQGPEHSSARLERFLAGCAENNITVANVTTATNFFHLLRRQLVRPFRKPLVVMTPKSGLRAPYNLGKITELLPGNCFREIIDDASVKPSKVKRLMVCSGKIYYDLDKYRSEHQRNDVAIVRLEQLYPFPVQQFEALLSKYKTAQLMWVQEEPANMGARGYLALHRSEYNWSYVSRPMSASPATGFVKVHEQQQVEVVRQAFE